MLTSYFECMVINEFVNIEGGVSVKNIHMIDLSIYWCI